jgi:microcystin-dependent protein
MKLLDTILISIFISLFVVYLNKPKVIEHQEGIVDTKSIKNLGEIAGKILNKNKLEIGSNVDILGDLNIIPNGTIVAYNKETAPPGWALCDGKNGTPDLRFKFILGNCNDHDGLCTNINKLLFNYNKIQNEDKTKIKTKFGETSGEFVHKLSVDEMPEHTHKYFYTELTDGGTGSFEYDDKAPPKKYFTQTDPAGKDMPHNNMPPYYILTYIIKIPYKKNN